MSKPDKKMTRLQADGLLFIVAIIWGGAFVAQKGAMDHVGAFTFVAARFFLSGFLVLPFAMRERKSAVLFGAVPQRMLALLAGSFIAGVGLQQAGLLYTTVTNSGFLTGLYVLFVPFFCLVLYRERVGALIFPAALLSVAGVWLLSGGGFRVMAELNAGDLMTIGCAAGFGLQVVLISRLMRLAKVPFQLAAFQYFSVAIFALVIALMTEDVRGADLWSAALPILYAGALSGGVAYTAQIIAQQYAPPSDAAVILSAESVFAAIFGAWLLAERPDAAGLMGCGLIVLAILLVEAPQLLNLRRTQNQGL